jgi:hypothetical protein
MVPSGDIEASVVAVVSVVRVEPSRDIRQIPEQGLDPEAFPTRS